MSEIHETTTYVPPTNDDWWIARLLAVKAAWAADQERLRVAEARLVEVEQALRIEPYDANDRPEWVHDCDLAVVEAWKRNHPNRQWWWFDPRPYVDAVLTAVLDKGEPTEERRYCATHARFLEPDEVYEKVMLGEPMLFHKDCGDAACRWVAAVPAPPAAVLNKGEPR